MEDLILAPNKDTLDIKCTSGKIKMEGRSTLSDSKKFFTPIMNWVDEYVKNPAQKTEIDLKFDYIDTSSIQQVFDFLKKLTSIPDFAEKVVVNWHFEFDDPELLELGEIMEGRLHIPFNYIEFSS